MQPRTLEQILAESEKYYAPQLETIKQRQAAVPGLIESDIQAANAAQTKAYEDILTGARRRGLGFSGIPLGEQAQYASTVYAPAILAARAKGTEYGLSLQDAINQIYANRYTQAQSQANWEKTFAENMRQANMAAQSAGGDYSPSYGQLTGTTDAPVEVNPDYNTARWYVDQAKAINNPAAEDQYLAKVVRQKNLWMQKASVNPNDTQKNAIERTKRELNYLRQIVGDQKYNLYLAYSPPEGYTGTARVVNNQWAY